MKLNLDIPQCNSSARSGIGFRLHDVRSTIVHAYNINTALECQDPCRVQKKEILFGRIESSGSSFETETWVLNVRELIKTE